MISVAGIDYSIASPGICVHPIDKDWDIKNCRFLGVPASKKLDDFYPHINVSIVQNDGSKETPITRYSNTATACVNFLKHYNAYTVAIEGYSFASKGLVYQIGENGGVLRLMMHQNNIKWTDLAPASLKKYATGSGRQDKNQMYDYFVNDTKLDFIKEMKLNRTKKLPSPVDDFVDAYYLCKYAYEELKDEKR